MLRLTLALLLFSGCAGMPGRSTHGSADVALERRPTEREDLSQRVPGAEPRREPAQGSVSTAFCPGLAEFVEQGMRKWGVPGAALAVVTRDSVLIARGYGVRRLGTSEPVSPATLFELGSATKTFTAAAIGILVAEGRLGWDDHVADHLPEFRLADPYASREITIRDLLAHRSGLPRGDLLWFAGGVAPTEMIRRLRHLEPAGSFRSDFSYSNLLYVVVGEIIRQAAGTDFGEFVAERIFAPLGMSRSLTGLPRDGTPDVATPHVELDGAVQPVPRLPMEAAPAGAILSSAEELARWLQFHLSERAGGDPPIVGPAVLREMGTVQTPITLRGFWQDQYPESRSLSYGLGWYVSDFRGRRMLDHIGGFYGMVAEVALLPDEGLGVVVLTNHGANLLPLAVTYRVLDCALGVRERDWNEHFLRAWRALRSRFESARRDADTARVEGTRPSLEAGGYAGRYGHPFYGEAIVSVDGGSLVLRYGAWVAGDLEHFHYDTFRIHWRDPIQRSLFGPGRATFVVGSLGGVESLRFTAFPGEEVAMRRVAAPSPRKR